MWLHLTFEDIAKRLLLTNGDIAGITKAIPKSVDEAYTAILERSPDKQMARKLLQIVLASIRPLTPREVNVAMVIEAHHERYEDLEMWPAEDSVSVIKNACGLFLSVVDSKVYLIHQTAREFLLHEKQTIPSPSFRDSAQMTWKNSFYLAQSNLLLTHICIWYLQLANFKGGQVVTLGELLPDKEIPRYKKTYSYLSYAAHHWAQHFTQAQTLPDAALVDIVAFETCDTLSWSFVIWYSVLTEGRSFSRKYPMNATHLTIASCFGCVAVVKRLLEEECVQINSKDLTGMTPLTWAARHGHQEVVRLLLGREDVQINSKDYYDWTPLLSAAANGHEVVVRLLLEQEDVQANLKDWTGATALSSAARTGREAAVELLLDGKDVQVDSKDSDGRTPLSWAARKGQEAVVKSLLSRKDVEVVQVVHVDSEAVFGRTPLSLAASSGHEAVVRILLKHGAQVALKDDFNRTPLYCASHGNQPAIVKLLLEHGAQAELKIRLGMTPLSIAKKMGHQEVVKILEEHIARTQEVSQDA